MSQTNVREGYRITTLEVVELVEDLTSYLLKSLRLPTLKDWLAVAKCTRLRNAQIPKVFYEAAARTIWTMMLAKVRYNTLTPTLSETAQRRSSSVVSNRSTALITDKFSVASLTEPAILNDANVALVDAVHHSQKLEENYFEVIDALTMTLIKDDDDLLGTVNSYIKLRRLGAPLLLEQPSPPKKRGQYSKLILDGPPLKRRKTEAADSRHAKASRGRTKKDKDSEDSDTSSNVPRLRRRDRAAARARLAERKRLGKEAQLKKTRDEEELAKAKKEKEEKEAQKRKTYSSDIDPKDNSEDEEATIAKDLAREQKERLKALLNAKTRDGLSARVGTAIEYCTLEEWTSAAVFFGVSINNLQNKRIIKLPAYAYILYFKELLSNNSGIFANAIGIGKTRAIVLATEVQNAQAEGDAIEHNAVNDDDKPCLTKSERTFYCADPLALRFCFFSDSPPENIGRLTKEEAIEMRINTTNAISKALAAANKLVAPQSYIIPEANTPAVHSKATKHYPAPSAARFVIVCSFGKVDKHVFRAYNTISVTAQRTIIRKGGPYIEKRAILLPSHQQCRDILEKEGLNKSEASRRMIFNRFEMQAIASYSALATLKAAQFKTYGSRKVKRFTLNSVKDLFTNLSKDYFLVREARAITKSSLKFQNLLNLCSESIAAEDAAKAANTLPPLKEVCAKILIESYKLIKFGDESVLVMQGGITQHEINLKLIMVALIAFAEAITLTEATHVVIIEPQDRQNTQDQFIIVYFNPDSELELKVLGKQDVKTTS
ncbi:hypothetical protein HBI44_224530 [Parastagonospora nodorum]|nr:hypothetical protein HBI44_224530 [Parastagonospora nodorum]